MGDKTLAELDRAYREAIHHIKYVSGDTVPELVASINRCWPVQRQGRPNALCQTGEEYVTFRSFVPFRAGELGEKVARKFAAQEMARHLSDYSTDRRGTLYWRSRPEEDIEDYRVVGAYDDKGPDKDFHTDRRCYLEPGWKMYGIYMRLLISDCPEIPE